MGCFLFQQGGLGRFRAPSPSRGLPQALASSSAMAAEEPQSWVQHGCVTGRALLGTLTAWDRLAAASHLWLLKPQLLLLLGNPAAKTQLKPCSKNSTATALLLTAGLCTQSSQQGFSPPSLLAALTEVKGQSAAVPCSGG